METKFLKECREFAIATLHWIGLASCILLCLGIIFLGILLGRAYYQHVWGPTPCMESREHVAQIEKVDGFYIKEGSEPFYKVRTFPNCKIKFYGRILTVKGGDIYDRAKCVTDKVSIKFTSGKYLVYYQKKCTPLTTTTKFTGLHYRDLYGEFVERDIYARDGSFYYDKDERHSLFLLFLLGIGIYILIYAIYIVLMLGTKVFNKEAHVIMNGICYIGDKLQKIRKSLRIRRPRKNDEYSK